MNLPIKTWFLLLTIAAVFVVSNVASLSCTSEEDCPEASLCVDRNNSTSMRCACAKGYKMSNKSKCVKKHRKGKNRGEKKGNSSDNQIAKDTEVTTLALLTTTKPGIFGAFGALGFQLVTGYTTRFPQTKEDCPGILRSQTSSEVCNNGAKCASDELGQNYCVCHPLLLGHTCNTEAVVNKSKGEEPPSEDFMHEMSDVYIRSPYDPDLWVVGRHEVATYEECVNECYQTKGCQSVQFGPMSFADETVNVCEMIDADLHPKFRFEWFDFSKGYISNRPGYQLACCFERTYNHFKDSEDDE